MTHYPLPINDPSMTHQSDKAYFLAFCIEQYAHRHSLTGEAAAEKIFEAGVAEYLTENFEALHTQSSQWLLEEVDQRIKQNNNE